MPVNEGWLDDGISIEALLKERFDLLAAYDIPALKVPETGNDSFMMTFRKRPR